MKITIWTIDNDNKRYEQFLDYLKMENIEANVERFKVLAEVYDKIGSPDIIFIDTTSIMGGITLYGCFDTAVSLVRGFTKKHTSSYIFVVSSVLSWAEDIIEDLIEDCKDNVVIKGIENDCKSKIKEIKRIGRLK